MADWNTSHIGDYTEHIGASDSNQSKIGADVKHIGDDSSSAKSAVFNPDNHEQSALTPSARLHSQPQNDQKQDQGQNKNVEDIVRRVVREEIGKFKIVGPGVSGSGHQWTINLDSYIRNAVQRAMSSGS